MTTIATTSPLVRAFIGYSRDLEEGDRQTITVWLDSALAREIVPDQLAGLQGEYGGTLQISRAESDGGIRITRTVIARDKRTIRGACSLIRGHLQKYLGIRASIHELPKPGDVQKLGR